jgi:predicted transposase YdaD
MNNVINTAAMEAEQRGREEGKQEGIELGKQEGIELGKQEGIELGKQEGIEAVARNMLNNGIDVALIAQMTGLTIEQVTALRH